tara:strand:- start:522 stop:752 length:231 start_codon:yes stop_codon:yes gene_type:complete
MCFKISDKFKKVGDKLSRLLMDILLFDFDEPSCLSECKTIDICDYGPGEVVIAEPKYANDGDREWDLVGIENLKEL